MSTRRSKLPSRSLVATFLALLLFAAVTGAAGQSAAKPQALKLEGPGPWVVRVATIDPATVGALATWADVWAVYPTKGYTVLQVDRADAERLVAEGHGVRLDERRTTRLESVGKALKNQTSGIPGFPCYRTVEETFASAEAIVAAHPDLATWTDVGDSWEKTDNPASGYDMKVLALTRSAIPGPKPILFANCAIHAREYATAELCTRFAELLIDGYGVDPDVTWLLDHHEVHLMLHTNPDGRKRAETGLSWRKNTNADYCSFFPNSIGADLNRNFEFQWACCGGSSGSECSSTYRGPAPASEPEIQALQGYVTSIFPDQRLADLSAPAPDDATGVAIDIHSHGELVLWSWGFTADVPPNGTQLQTLGRKLAFFNGHEPKQGIGLYPTDGSSKDFYYGELGIAGFVFELGTEFFESCVYFEDSILPGNLPSLLYAGKVVRTPYLTPAGPDALDVAVPPRAFAPGEAVPVTATADDTRYSTRLGSEPSQAIAAAELYVNLPPWETGAAPLAMTAADGTFDATVETVAATLDTTGFAPGRVTLFVRAMDADANWGAVSAVFLHVIDPASAPTIQGTVRDAVTLAPLAAAVSAGDFETTTDAAGFYSMQVPAGTYDVTVVAAGYQSATSEGVAAADFQTVTEDFDLDPFAGVWADDAEAGNPGWTVGSPWAISTEAAFSPTHAWSDSPGTLYGNGVNASLTSPVFDLGSYTGMTLSFRHVYDLEQSFDFGYVEISTDGGASWTAVAVFTGTDQTASWRLEEIALPALDGQTQARLRFRLDTDDSVQEDGWHLDDVLLAGVFEACVGDPDCDDGLYCNGAETCLAGSCQAGTPIDCADGVTCTVDACNEATDSCESTPDDGFCSNGLFCDGAETCDALLGCQAGTPVVCDDGVACTVDSCDEGADACDFAPDDGFCSNGVFCDGAEVCDPALGCQAGTAPSCDDGVACTVDSCDGVTDACAHEADDLFCDNGLFCDGAETCDPFADCQAGSDPCGVGETCDEAGDLCVSCLPKHAPCTQESDCCSGDCKPNGTCR